MRIIALDTLGPQLAPLEAKHNEQAKQLEDVTKKISQAMDNYNGIVSSCKLTVQKKILSNMIYIGQYTIRDFHFVG